MAVRRLDPEQPSQFAFNAENLGWAELQIAKFPAGRQASAIVPLLWRAQEQCGGWLPEPAIRHVSEMLGMAHIRGLEIATFYTMFQLSPVGKVAHFQVCGTTPCMLSGSRALIDVCKARISAEPHHVSADGKFSWEEVECLGVCANAPMVQIDKDTFEDLTPSAFEQILDTLAAGKKPKPGSQIGRTASSPAGGPTTLKDPSLYDGSTVGAWKKRFEDEATPKASGAVEAQPPSASASPAHKAETASGPAPASPPFSLPASQPFSLPAFPASQAPAMNTGAMAAMANAGLVKELETRSSGKALSIDEIEKMKASSVSRAPASSFAAVDRPTAVARDAATQIPELLTAARDGRPDDLGLIWGVGEKLAERLNAMGIWHFDQIAVWTPAHVSWFENEMPGFKGRVARDKWIEQCEKLSGGWRPEGTAGERPKGA